MRALPGCASCRIAMICSSSGQFWLGGLHPLVRAGLTRRSRRPRQSLSQLISCSLGPHQPVARCLFLAGREMLHLARHERGNQAGPEMMCVRRANNCQPTKVPQMTQAEFDVMPKGGSIHTFEILYDFQHANLAVSIYECFELGGNAVKLLR